SYRADDGESGDERNGWFPASRLLAGSIHIQDLSNASRSLTNPAQGGLRQRHPPAGESFLGQAGQTLGIGAGAGFGQDRVIAGHLAFQGDALLNPPYRGVKKE